MKKLLILLFSLLISFHSWGETKYLYYGSGQIKQESNYQGAKLNGKSTRWFENGQIMWERYYGDGLLITKEESEKRSPDAKKDLSDLEIQVNPDTGKTIYLIHGEVTTEKFYKRLERQYKWEAEQKRSRDIKIKEREEKRETSAKNLGYKSYDDWQANKKKKLDDMIKAEDKIKADKKKVEYKKRADKKKAEDKIKKELKKRVITQARKVSKNNPGFRDLKPAMYRGDYIKNCIGSKCYGIQNISFSPHFKNKNGIKVVSYLTLDMGPIASDGILIDLINEFADPDANIFRKMKTNFDTKYILEYEFSQRDRQLFNEREKSELLVVYSKGQVALRITRDFSLYIEYRDISEARAFLKRNKPVTAAIDDF